MRNALTVLSVILSCAAVIFCVLTGVQHHEWRKRVAAHAQGGDPNSPKFTWKQQVSVTGGFFRGREAQVLSLSELKSKDGEREYLISVEDSFEVVRAKESELSPLPDADSPTSPGSSPPSDVDALRPHSGALYYKSYEGRLYRGDVDTVQPVRPRVQVANP